VLDDQPEEVLCTLASRENPAGHYLFQMAADQGVLIGREVLNSGHRIRR